MMSLSVRNEYLAFGRPNFGEQEIAVVQRVLQSGWIGMGPETLEFERELADATGAPHVVTVNSCTSALTISLRIAGVGPGDEVICPSLTWCSTANAALYLGASPVFADVSSDTFNVTPLSVMERITARTKAVIIVHFGGLAADIAGIRAVVPERIAIVEDAAHAFGGRYADGKPVGSSGNAVCFSFYANKNLSTGEGGAIAFSDFGSAEKARSLRQHALPVDAWKRFVHAPSLILSPQLDELGYKANFTDLQAAIGRVQLQRQQELSAIRAKIALRYTERLQALPQAALRAQQGLTSPLHARHLFAVTLNPDARMTRDELLYALRQRNIGATIHYAPLHQMPLYARHGMTTLPNTETVASRIFTLPISAHMQILDVDYVCDHLSQLLA